MRNRGRLLFLGLAALAGVGGWLYNRRPRGRIPCAEGLDDPEVARAFGWVTRMPPMRLMRHMVASRAVRMASGGEAVDLDAIAAAVAVTVFVVVAEMLSVG